MLIVLDGWGYSESTAYNAIAAARTPVWDALWAEAPHSLIRCSGTDVGLPDEQMGNSEVGHMHLGAGRLIDQDLTRIGKAIHNGEFMRNATLLEACREAAGNGRTVHILGLASPGGVHSHEDHLHALIDLARGAGAPRVLVHAFLDGRDTPPKSAGATLSRLATHCAASGRARVASIVGRYFAMDRNQRWERVALAYDLITQGAAPFAAGDVDGALAAAYARGETDEFVQATIILDTDGTRHAVVDGDVVIFANFRADRARELTTAFTSPSFSHFPRAAVPALGAFVTMTDYGAQFDLPVAYPATEMSNTFGAVLAGHGLKQLRIAETEKYAHVTFFFNGGEERVFEGEDRILIPSPDVPTYDLKPEMSAAELTDRLVEAVKSRRYDAIVCNYANADMVGHTGDFAAAVRAIEALDSCLGRVLDAARTAGVDVLITADHGNAEQMRGEPGGAEADNPHTAHTSNLVPLVYVGREARFVKQGSLVDIAPTLLALMGLEIPREMTGTPLLRLPATAQDAA